MLAPLALSLSFSLFFLLTLLMYRFTSILILYYFHSLPYSIQYYNLKLHQYIVYYIKRGVTWNNQIKSNLISNHILSLISLLTSSLHLSYLFNHIISTLLLLLYLYDLNTYTYSIYLTLSTHLILLYLISYLLILLLTILLTLLLNSILNLSSPQIITIKTHCSTPHIIILFSNTLPLTTTIYIYIILL